LCLIWINIVSYIICVQALEAELLSREPVVQALVGRAQRMIRSGHFAASRIEACSTELTEKMGHLRDLASVRRLRLLDAVESQMVSADWR
jgi:spectrin beta